MKNVLLLVHDDVGQEARFQAALDITRALDGHLTCLDVAILPALTGDPYFPEGGAMLLQDERAREDVNCSRIKERLAHEDVAWEISTVTGDLAPCMEAAAGLADLVVVNRKLDQFPYPDMAALVGELIVKSGKPIVAVPDDARGFNAAGRAIVAWDGSPASTAALQAATPLLTVAESVIIVEIHDGSIQTPAREGGCLSFAAWHSLADPRQESAWPPGGGYPPLRGQGSERRLSRDGRFRPQAFPGGTVRRRHAQDDSGEPGAARAGARMKDARLRSKREPHLAREGP